jgi:hypothetical protein
MLKQVVQIVTTMPYEVNATRVLIITVKNAITLLLKEVASAWFVETLQQ